MLKPYFARVLLRREKFEKAGSILIPTDQQKRYASTRCVVLAKGPDASDQIAVGSTVLIGQHAGAWINADGKPASEGDDEYFIAQDEDILCEVSDD